MFRFFACLALAGGLLAADLSAAETPGRGKFLVASRQLQGPAFAEAVILLIHYDETGAMGLIVNQPTSLTPARALPRLPALANYRGSMYLGGPVDPRRVLALVRAEQPPASAATIVAGVHFAPLNDDLLEDAAMDVSRLRLYVGYAGWGPGQLDAELARGSWHVMAASDELVFSDEPDAVWQRLLPPPRYQVDAMRRSRFAAAGRQETATARSHWQELRGQLIQVSPAEPGRTDMIIRQFKQPTFCGASQRRAAACRS